VRIIKFFVGLHEGRRCLANSEDIITDSTLAKLSEIIEAASQREPEWDLKEEIQNGDIVALADGNYYAQWQQGALDPEEVSLIFTNLQSKKKYLVW